MVKPSQQRRQGASLIEALVAMLVMAFGLMAVTTIQSRLRHSGDSAKQRTEATRLAQAELQRLRSFAALTREPSTPSTATVYAEFADQRYETNGISTRYSVERRVRPLAQAGLELQLRLSWRDRTLDDSDTALSLTWLTAVAAADPKLLVAAQLAPDAGVPARRSMNRHPAIPVSAHRLDAERSVLKPQESGDQAWLLDNRSGEVLQICRVRANLRTADIRSVDLNDCRSRMANGSVLLSGNVRFALGLQPNPELANDAVLAGVGVTLQVSQPPNMSAPLCQAQARSDAGEQYLAYHCLIERPAAETNWQGWSGRSLLSGLRFAPGGHRVCRYSDDFDGDSRIDNAEHPLDYQAVTESLAHQNFLVIAFEAPCPLGRRFDLTERQYRNSRTANHQPL